MEILRRFQAKYEISNLGWNEGNYSMINLQEIITSERECIKRRNTDSCSRDCTHCDLEIQKSLMLDACDEILLLLRKKDEGRLVELPYGVGDTLYYLDYIGYNNFPTIHSLVVESQAQAINLAFSLSKHQYYTTFAEAQKELDSLR